MKLKQIAGWVLVAILAAVFAIAGGRKLPPSSAWAPLFAAWGYPWWMRPLVGSIELASAVAILFPRTRRSACGVLLGIMLAAAATHLAHGEPRRIVLNAALAALLALAAWTTTANRR